MCHLMRDNFVVFCLFCRVFFVEFLFTTLSVATWCMVVLETFQEVEFLGTVFCPLFSPCGPVDQVKCPLLFVLL